MVFSSIPFLYFFLPVTLLCYLVAPRKLKNTVLLVFSLLFYWWGEPKYALLMVFTITFCFVAGIIIENRRTHPKGKLLLGFSAAVPLGLLALFKYADFLIGSVNSLTGADIPLLKLALPIGISFYTFQALSYLVDVYRGDVPAQKNYINLATYIVLFPQLIAGPIVRYTTVVEDLKSRRHSKENVALGIRRFVMGLGKKVLVANLLGSLCTAYRESAEPSVLFAWVYAVSYALQIYFDFSAYSDMAIGTGKILGFRFLENFDYPFISKSITEFWRRWHISLGSWFRDYVYIPLGGNRVGAKRQIFNILVVWCLTGLWHGASWTYMAWGLYFGILLIIEKLFLKRHLEKLPAAFQHIYVLLLVLVSFVLFNAETFTMAKDDLAVMFGLGGMPLISDDTLYNLSSYAVLLLVAVIGATPACKRLFKRLEAKPAVQIVEVITVAAVLILSTAYLVDGSFNPFLYFRF
ncbi:MAG: MBOAT family protein [Ruminococcaceae bacterium]|nr:MBOAT family protein [Oscillospiraceae bacterium]